MSQGESQGPAPTIFETFEVFSGLHLAVVVVCAAAMVGAAIVGRRLARDGREPVFRRGWCVFVLAWQIAATTWWCWPSNFQPAVSLPLHLCDLGGILAAITLWTQWRWSRALLYFWAIGLSTQAFITPVEKAGIGHIQFWLFWVGHTQIVGSAVYDIVTLQFRPTWRDYVSATGLSVLYVAIMIPLNLSFGFNYGYVGKKLPEARTILHDLPDWPWRVVVLALIGQVAFLAIWLPWEAARWARRDRQPGERVSSDQGG